MTAHRANARATQTLLLLGAPVTPHDLMVHTNAHGNTRQLRVDLQAWAADTLSQHRSFHDTFLFGCSAHPSTSVTEEPVTLTIPLLPSNHLTPPLGSTTFTTGPIYDADGALITETITTTLAPSTVTTTITRTRTTNPYLPIIGDLEHIRIEIAAYVGIVVGAELRHLRAIGPAIAAIDWAAHDQPWDGAAAAADGN